MNLQGKTAIVTGGAVRLGRAIALALARAGANIGLHFGTSHAAAEATAAEIRALGAAVCLVQADLADHAAAARHVVSETTAALGGADILINSAALFPAGSLQAITPETWDRTLAVNLGAPLFLCREFAAQLQSGQPAHIVNVIDWRAQRIDPEHLIYTLTKSGLLALTRNLAVDLAPTVQVNAVAPGAILPPAGADDDYLASLAQRVPLRRTGGPADVTDAVLYLLRSEFITGEVIHVAGGQQI